MSADVMREAFSGSPEFIIAYNEFGHKKGVEDRPVLHAGLESKST